MIPKNIKLAHRSVVARTFKPNIAVEQNITANAALINYLATSVFKLTHWPSAVDVYTGVTKTSG
jgi:hypothetical protein